MIDVSIIIRNYNNAPYVGRAIRSCLNQTFRASEIIVVDDASTDNSKEVIDTFREKIVRIYLNKNVGVAEAANAGIRNALGRFIFILDSDDYINSNTTLFMREILDKNPDIGFVYADHICVDENENQLNRVNLDTLEKILRHGAGIMMRKSYLEKLGLYDTIMRNAEDHELLLRYIKNFNGFRIPIPFYRYRQHPNQITKNQKEREKWEKIAENKNV